MRHTFPPELLTDDQADALLAMPRHDQAHMVRVYERLRGQSGSDQDLLVAALLHDIGKATHHGRVRLIDRVLLVLLGPLAVHLSALPAPAWRRGLAVAARHAELGAIRAAELGCTGRACWLIQHHHDAAPTDPALRLLQAADRVD